MGESYFWKPFAQGVATPIVLIGGTNLLLKDFKVSNPYLYWGGLAASSAIVLGILADKIKVPILNAEGDSWDGTTGDDFRKYDDMELTEDDHETLLEEIEMGFENYPADTLRNAKASAVSQINWFGIDNAHGEYDAESFSAPSHCASCGWNLVQVPIGTETKWGVAIEGNQYYYNHNACKGIGKLPIKAESFNAEDDGWVKSTASERISDYSSFLRKKQFHFEKEFTMPPYPNTLKIDVDGYFTGISYEDEDESYFNTPKFIKERKEFVKIYTDSKLQEILEKYTMSKVKEYYEEIADDWVLFEEREEEEIEEEDMSDWGWTDEEIAEYKQEMAEEKAEEKAQKMADLEEERNSHIEYCDNYFKKQMNRYMSDWNNSWMVEETNGQGQFMGHILPTFLPTHIKFVDETRGITLYEYNQGGDILSYDAETFEAQGKPTWAGYCPFCKKWRTTEWSKKYGGDTVCAKIIPDPHYNSGDEALFVRENFARKGGKWIRPKENICGVVLEKKQSKKRGYHAETFEDQLDYVPSYAKIYCSNCKKESPDYHYSCINCGSINVDADLPEHSRNKKGHWISRDNFPELYDAETFNAKQIRREPQYQLAFDDWPLKIHVEHCPMNPFRRGGSTYTPKEIAQQSYTILYNHESLPQFEGNTFGELRKASSGLIVPCNCTINEMKVIKELDPATFTRKPDETQEHWDD